MLITRDDEAKTAIPELSAVALIGDQRRLGAEIRCDLAGRYDDPITVLAGDLDEVVQFRALFGIVDAAGFAEQCPQANAGKARRQRAALGLKRHLHTLRRQFA